MICGYRGFKRLQFINLLDVFDRKIWVVLFLFEFALSVIFKQVPSVGVRLKMARSSIVPVPGFPEQGNPFPRFLLHNPRGKISAAGLLLMGIVLINTYKNTNVYNMIIPRKPVLFEHLHDLTDESFTTLTRSYYFTIFYLSAWMRKNISDSTLHIKRDAPHFRICELHSKLKNLNNRAS